MAPQSLRKTFLGCETGKRLGEDLHLKGAEKEFTITSFLKKFSKQREVRDLCQEETCLKVSQVEGKPKILGQLKA